jgi:hypothetical protein
MTGVAASPRAQRASASRRSSGQAYDPGLGAGPAGRIRRWCPLSNRWRAAVMHPAAFHTPINETTKSRPDRLRRNSGDRCSAQSHTETPKGSLSCSRGPRPGPMQIAHGGRFPIPRALYNVHGMAPIVRPTPHIDHHLTVPRGSPPRHGGCASRRPRRTSSGA